MACAVRLISIGGLVCAAALTAAQAETAPPKPAPGDPSALSSEFWGDWNLTKASEEFTALTNTVGRADKSTAAVAANKANGTQTIVNLAIETSEDAAKFLDDASAASNDAASANALATVVNMVTSPKTREEAAPLVAPEAQERVEAVRANLSTGIQGLPGIYLGDNAAESARPAAPAGYAPVAGSSIACPAR